MPGFRGRCRGEFLILREAREQGIGSVNWIIGIEHLLNESKYDTQEKRVERREELYPILDEAFSKKTRAEWQEIFRKAKMRLG